MGLSSHFSTILGTGITPGINENLITQVYGRPIHAFDLTDLIKGVVMIQDSGGKSHLIDEQLDRYPFCVEEAIRQAQSQASTAGWVGLCTDATKIFLFI